MGECCSDEKVRSNSVDEITNMPLRGGKDGKSNATGAGRPDSAAFVMDMSEYIHNEATLARYKSLGPLHFSEDLSTWRRNDLENDDVVFSGRTFRRGERKTGFCIYVNASRDMIFEGYLENDKYAGEDSRVITASGEVLQGMWEHGTLNGKGVYMAKNNDRYEGDFRNGIFHGKGEYFFADGRKYEGEYFNGKRQGQGSLHRD